MKAPLLLSLLFPLGAMALTLQEALDETARAGFAPKISRARAAESSAQELAAWRGLLPTVRAEGGWMTTNDPLSAFGTSLRQRQVSMASFDPARLNDPPRTSGWNAAVVAEVPLVNLDAWAGRAAATHASAAAKSRTRADELQAAGATVRAYADAVLASAAVRAFDDALVAAKSHCAQAEAGHQEGIALRADLLLAKVRSSEIEASLAKARGDSALAWRGLGFAMGSEAPPTGELQALPDAATLRTAMAALDVGSDRPLIDAAHKASSAAQLDADRAGFAMLPRVNGMARMDWNGADQPFAEEGSWTVGIMASWTLHATGEAGERAAARARLEQARSGEAMARAQVALAESSLQSDFAVSLRRMEIADSALSQAVEAHRLTARRYQEGLATMAEVLQAAAMETSARISLEQARHDAFIALSDLSALRGLPAERIAQLTPSTSAR